MSTPPTTPKTAAGPRPFFERSELSLGNVNRALARFRGELAAAKRRPLLTPSRLFASRTAVGTSGPITLAAEDALTRFMSIADEFTLRLLVDLTERKLPSDDRVGLLWERYEERHTDSWEQRFASWDGLHDIKMKDFPRYSPLLGYIEARNAIVHGLGSLTRKQLKTETKVVGRLKTARINTVGDRLVLTADHATDCASVVRDLIEWLDERAATVR